MAETLRLTRSQLSSFLNGNHELIKQFEALFAVADTIAPDFVDESLIAAGIADAKAQEALDTLTKTARRAKSNEVLTWLSM